MHIAVNSQLFAQELRLLNKVAPTKAPLQILTHVRLEATADSLEMCTTDLEVGLRTSCKARGIAPGSVTLPVATLLGMVDRFLNDDVVLVADKTSVSISCGAFASRISGLPVTDFPTVPDVAGPSALIDSLSLNKLLTRTRYVVSETANQFMLRGALLALNGEMGAMVSTDGKRLAVATMKRALGTEIRATIPMKTLDMLIALPLTDKIEVTVGERHLFFQMGERLLISRTLEGEFPKFERIIPQNSDKKAVISRYALAAALRRVGLIAGTDSAAQLTFSAESVEITSRRAEVGEAGEKVPVQYEGDSVTVCCNWQFLVDFLEASTTANISIQLKDDKTPLLLTEGDDHLAVIMLMANT